ncbi:MAG: hypothetical protein J5780_06000 [Treponema sp.]|nr:hypothetical protein [Treponema sp.]
MFGKKFALTLILASFCLALGAESVAFCLIQHDSSSENIRFSSYVIEDSLFDYFFSRGFIVTNSPAEALKDSDDESKSEREALGEAREGGCEYFVLLSTQYDTSESTSPESLSTDNIKTAEWKLYDVKADTVIRTGKRIPSRKKSSTMQAGVSDFAFELADDIYKAIHQNK